MTRLSKIPAKVAFLFCTLFCLWPCFVFSQQVDTAWVRRYNGPGNGDDQATSIAVDSSGNVYVTGFCFDSTTGHDYCTIKYLPNGDTAWVRKYDGPAHRNDFSYAMALDKSGNVYVTGNSYIYYNPGPMPAEFAGLATIKYDPQGNLLWVSEVSCGFGFEACTGAGYALAVDDQENVYVTGWFFDLFSTSWLTIKYDSNGNGSWVARENNSNPSPPHGIAVDNEGNVLATHADSMIKYDLSGNRVWAQSFPGASSAIALDNSGNAFVTGTSESDYATIKYLPNGDTVWLRRYSGPGGFGDYAYAIEVDSFGNVYVAGESNGPGTSQDFATIKYYPNGDTAWVRRYNGPGNDNEERPSLAIDNPGNVYITGPSADVGSVYDFATIKYDSLGNEVWVKRYNGPGDSDDHSNAIAVDTLGNVYVTGRSLSDTTYDYATIKYAPLPQLKGDLNLDGVLSLQDVIFSLNCTFLGEAPPAAPAACDINCDGKISPADVVVLLNMVFLSVAAPC